MFHLVGKFGLRIMAAEASFLSVSKRRQQWRWLAGAIARSGEGLRPFLLLASY